MSIQLKAVLNLIESTNTDTQMTLTFKYAGAEIPDVILVLNHPLTESQADEFIAGDYSDFGIVITNLNTDLVGKVVKIDDEEILITNVNTFDISSPKRINPDGGYFFDQIYFNITRGYNGTTIANHTGIISQTYPYIKNAIIGEEDNIISVNVNQKIEIDSNNTQSLEFKQGVNQTIALSDKSTSLRELLQNINQIIGVNNTFIGNNTITQNVSQVLGVQTRSDFLKLIIQNVIETIAVKNTQTQSMMFSAVVNQLIKHTELFNGNVSQTILQIVNELIVIKDNYTRKVDYMMFIQQTLAVYQNMYAFDETAYLIVVKEILKVVDNSTSALDAIKIIEILVNELISINGSEYHYVDYTQYVLEHIAINNTLNGYADYLITFNDKIAMSSSNTVNMEYSVFVKQLLSTQFLITLNNDVYESYCINLDNDALTRYDFKFNSYTKFNNEYYAMNDKGLCMLGGNTDDGELIKSKVKTGYFNIANIQTKSNGLSSIRDKQKRLKAAYLIVKNDNSFVFRIYNDEGKAFDYRCNEVYDNEKFRTEIGKGIKSSMYQFELETEGSFELKDCELIPIVLNRRI